MVSIRRIWFAVASLVLYAGLSLAGEPIEIEIVVADRASLVALSSQISISDYVDGVATAVCSPAQIIELRQQGFVFSEIHRPKATQITMCPDGWQEMGTPSWDCYPTYQQYEDLMYRLADTFPSMCRLHNLGRSANLNANHYLLALEISDFPDLDEVEPEVFITSTMHGDETAGYILMLRFAFDLLTRYGSDEAVTALVDETEIWINPLANPDGTYFGGDQTVSAAIRFLTTPDGLSSWINPNRNFPDPQYGPYPQGDPWWPETIAMMSFAESRNINLSANLHGGAELINYPWDTWCDRHPDDTWYFDLSMKWATAAQEDGPAGYMDDCRQPLCSSGACVPGVTNGADWYSIAGGRQDFMTYFHGGREVTVELSNTKLVSSDQLETIWTANRRAVVDFIGSAQRGIHGTVIDAGNGRPLSAQIEVIGLDTAQSRSAVQTDPSAGDFHRLLNPGVYDLRVTSPGRWTTRVDGVEVPATGPFPTLEITLEPVEGAEYQTSPEM